MAMNFAEDRRKERFWASPAKKKKVSNPIRKFVCEINSDIILSRSLVENLIKDAESAVTETFQVLHTSYSYKLQISISSHRNDAILRDDLDRCHFGNISIYLVDTYTNIIWSQWHVERNNLPRTVKLFWRSWMGLPKTLKKHVYSAFGSRSVTATTFTSTKCAFFSALMRAKMQQMRYTGKEV